MGLMIIKNMKMRSNSRHWCLFILLFTVVISLGNADDQSGIRSTGADHASRLNLLQFNTKNNNRDLREISVEKQQTHHHQHHIHHHNQKHQSQPTQQQQQQHHHLRHHNGHNGHNDASHRSGSSGNHHKQHDHHQSNDSALNRIPASYTHQTHAPKKYSHYDDDNAAAVIDGGGLKTKTHLSHHNRQQHDDHQYGITTQGPFESAYNRSNGWSWSGDGAYKRNWSDNLSRSRQVPINTSYSRNRASYNLQSAYRAHHTTTTTSTTTLAPDFPEKVSFDGIDNLNDIESDELDESDYSSYDDNIKRPPHVNSQQRHYIKPVLQSNLHFQRDDPVRNAAFRLQHSSNGGDNYLLNDGIVNDKRTIEPTKSVVDDFQTRPTTRNTRTINALSNGLQNGLLTGQLTQQKFDTLGDSQRVAETFRIQFPTREERRQANAHFQRILLAAACRLPKPRVIPIEHHPSKTYYPHCTVLHRCSNDSGCCTDDTKTCQPFRTENVTLPFFVIHMDQSTSSSRNRPQFSAINSPIEWKNFVNHTECRCQNIASQSTLAQLTQLSVARCNCPNHFTNTKKWKCKCDCASQANNMCNKLKMGLEHFSILERKCIREDRCDRPTCAYGDYDIQNGHCPRDEDRWSPKNSHQY